MYTLYFYSIYILYNLIFIGSVPEQNKNYFVVQLFSRVQLFVTPWTAAHQAFLFTEYKSNQFISVQLLSCV